MRTKFIYLLSLIIGGVFLNSCENMLDEVDQQGTTSIESFYKTDNDAEEAIAAVTCNGAVWHTMTFF
jgi:hypothetical protein